MANPQNEAIVRRSYDLITQPELPPDYAQIIHANFDNHQPQPFQARGPEGFKNLHDFLNEGFSELSITVEEILSDGDLVAVHYTMRGKHTGTFMGKAPTGKSIEITGTGIYRVQDGKLSDVWVNPDQFGMLQQIGMVEVPGMPQQRAA